MAVLSSADRAFWEENGYVVIHNAAPLELIQNVEQAVWNFLEMDADNQTVGTPNLLAKASW